MMGKVQGKCSRIFCCPKQKVVYNFYIVCRCIHKLIRPKRSYTGIFLALRKCNHMPLYWRRKATCRFSLVSQDIHIFLHPTKCHMGIALEVCRYNRRCLYSNWVELRNVLNLCNHKNMLVGSNFYNMDTSQYDRKCKSQLKGLEYTLGNTFSFPLLPVQCLPLLSSHSFPLLLGQLQENLGSGL